MAVLCVCLSVCLSVPLLLSSFTGVPDWMKYTHHVLELKESYPRLSLPYGHLWQCCDTREVPPGRLGDVERKDCLAVDVLPVSMFLSVCLFVFCVYASLSLSLSLSPSPSLCVPLPVSPFTGGT
ncbi:hypothetical protein MHYP_G00361140, partial [Metynnis hypsauchen]